MDEVFKSDVHYQDHTDVLTHKLSQPTEQVILDRNTRLRNNPGVIQDLGAQSEGGSWGRQIASIPLIIFEKAVREGYDLKCQDQKVAGLEMNRFLQTPEGKACLVQGD